MKLTSLVLSIALPVLAWADDKPKPAKVDGTWLPVSAKLGDMPFPEAILKGMSLTLVGNKYLVKVDPQVDKGTWKLVPGTKVQGMGITGKVGPNKGKTIPTIIRHEGDKLTVCCGMAGKRPTKFDTAGRADLFLVVYQRQKAKEK